MLMSRVHTNVIGELLNAIKYNGKKGNLLMEKFYDQKQVKNI